MALQGPDRGRPITGALGTPGLPWKKDRGGTVPSVGLVGKLTTGSTAESFWLWISGLGIKVSLMNLETGARQGNH